MWMMRMIEDELCRKLERCIINRGEAQRKSHFQREQQDDCFTMKRRSGVESRWPTWRGIQTFYYSSPGWVCPHTVSQRKTLAAVCQDDSLHEPVGKLRQCFSLRQISLLPSTWLMYGLGRSTTTSAPLKQTEDKRNSCQLHANKSIGSIGPNAIRNALA